MRVVGSDCDLLVSQEVDQSGKRVTHGPCSTVMVVVQYSVASEINVEYVGVIDVLNRDVAPVLSGRYGLSDDSLVVFCAVCTEEQVVADKTVPLKVPIFRWSLVAY